jgi:hypothetical protein
MDFEEPDKQAARPVSINPIQEEDENVNESNDYPVFSQDPKYGQ